MRISDWSSDVCSSDLGMNVARIGVLLAGLPNTIAAQTINRFCSSGLQAVALAADQVRLGNADLVLAGGTESMSMVPMMGNKVALSPNVFRDDHVAIRSEEHTSELQSLMRISYAVFCLKKKKKQQPTMYTRYNIYT